MAKKGILPQKHKAGTVQVGWKSHTNNPAHREGGNTTKPPKTGGCTTTNSDKGQPKQGDVATSRKPKKKGGMAKQRHKGK